MIKRIKQEMQVFSFFSCSFRLSFFILFYILIFSLSICHFHFQCVFPPMISTSLLKIFLTDIYNLCEGNMLTKKQRGHSKSMYALKLSFLHPSLPLSYPLPRAYILFNSLPPPAPKKKHWFHNRRNVLYTWLFIFKVHFLSIVKCYFTYLQHLN